MSAVPSYAPRSPLPGGGLIVGLGEILWDLLPAGRQLGGAPANFAFHAAQLGHAAVPVSRVGTDDLGRDIRTALAGLGLPDRFVQTDPTCPTGTVAVAVDAAGQPQYTITENVAWDHLAWTPDLHQLAVACHAVCFGTLAQRDPDSRATIRQFVATAARVGALVVADINLRQHFYDRECVEASLVAANWLKLNDDELPVVARILGIEGTAPDGALAELRGRYRLDLVCLTRGAKGCYVQTAEDVVEEPGIPVAVVDTVGAGDSFTAALVAATLEGRPLAEAVRLANRLAARVAGAAGATPRIERGEIDRP
jgi:fructokinase